MKNIHYTLILTITLCLFFNYQCNDSKDKSIPKKDKKNSESSQNNMDSDDYLKKINESLAKKDEEDLKSTDTTSEDKDSIPDDGSWVILIDNENKISKKEFETEYNRFIQTSGQNISKKNFVNVFFQNRLINNKAKSYFYSSPSRIALVQFIRKQTIVENYIRSKYYSEQNHTPNSTELKAFYNEMIKYKQFKKMDYITDRKKILNLYKIQSLNKQLQNFEQSLLGRYRIYKNDRFEQNLIHKYSQKNVNLQRALGRNYKNYWLFKIVIGKPNQIKSPKIPLHTHVKKDLIPKKSKSYLGINQPIIFNNATEKDINTEIIVDNPLDKPNKSILNIEINKSTSKLDKSSDVTENKLPDQFPEEYLFPKDRFKGVKSVNFYIRDIENKIRLTKITGSKPQLIRAFYHDPKTRSQYINQFLLEELIYKYLTDRGLINRYLWLANKTVDNYVIGYYIKFVLGIHTQDQQRKYLLKYIESHNIRYSNKYFNPEKNE